ncbi:MAG TPA: ATP-grasp domain-containing protein, partial [Candidatus Acidoferrales bacterium]|nr:ATP-grasp domain-containing protein [Candidatus Acidoferrales bacterium]
MPPSTPTRPQRVLILASKLGYQTRAFTDAAKKLNLEIHFGTDRCHKLDDPWSDNAQALHFENPQSAAATIATQLAENRPDAIIALGDRPTATAAHAARDLGLPGNPPEAVELCRNKLHQREAHHRANLPVPDYFGFSQAENLDSVIARVKFPCVLKPLSLSASQGVIRANNEIEFRAAVRRIRALLESPEIQVLREPNHDRLLVERYIPGREVAIEALLTNGNLRVLAIFDKPDPLEGPFFEETIYVTPSRLPDSDQRAVIACAERSVAALGLITGPIHAEFRINEHGPWIIEIAPRPIGGLCAQALRFGNERISLEELILRHALGMEGNDLQREAAAAGVMMIPVPRSGVLEDVTGLDLAEKVAGIEAIRITARPHDYIAAWPEGNSYLGFIFSSSETPEAAEAALRSA